MSILLTEGASHLYIYNHAITLLPDPSQYAETALGVLAAVKSWRDGLDEIFIFDR